MSPVLTFSVIAAYFLLLVFIARRTSVKATNSSFFIGDRQSKWYVVAFGMIGASLSGVTFISIPGTFDQSEFSYSQIALGYVIGYAVISFVLMPVYYKLQLTSIYGYLHNRFGNASYKTGSVFFLLSRIIGASLRLYLVANVLQLFLFNHFGIPFEITVAMSILLIWLYTSKGGIKTIIWTDTLQTLFMLIALGLSLFLISRELNLGPGGLMEKLEEMGCGNWFYSSDIDSPKHFMKQILAGAFIAICMTGLDQDMMQKNLSCRNLKEAKKNMMSFSAVLLFVNIAFLILGALLFVFIEQNPGLKDLWLSMSGGGKFDSDILFPVVAMHGELGVVIGIVFLLGLIAAAYSSADSALTSLTTSFCVDIIDIEKKEKEKQEALRKKTHVIMSVVLLFTILIFKWMKSDSVIWELFKAAQYTYGPLLGLYAFGLFTKIKPVDKLVPLICVIAPLLTFFTNDFLSFMDISYRFGFELIVINGLITGLLLWVSSWLPKRI